MNKFTLKTVALTAAFLLTPVVVFAQTAEIPQTTPKAPIVPVAPSTPIAPNLPVVSNPAAPALPVPGAPLPLVDGAVLPDGQILHLGPGESAHAIPRSDGSIDHVIVDFQDGKERMRVFYKEGSGKLVKGEEHRADGTLKWKTMPTFGGPPAIVRYWPKPNDGEVYNITDTWGKGKRVEYKRPHTHSFALTQEYDASGKLIGEVVGSDLNQDNLKYQWNEIPGQGVHITYFFEDLGSIDFSQSWKSLPGTPEPQVTVSWTNDNGLPESYDVTLSSDGSRAVKVVYKNKSGDDVTDTVTPDGKYIASRKTVSATTQAVIKDITFGNNKPRLLIPASYLKAPPKPVDPGSIGFADPD